MNLRILKNKSSEIPIGYSPLIADTLTIAREATSKQWRTLTANGMRFLYMEG